MLVTRQRSWQGRKSTHGNLCIFHNLVLYLLEQQRFHSFRRKHQHLTMSERMQTLVELSWAKTASWHFCFVLCHWNTLMVREQTFVQRREDDCEGGQR